MNRLFLCLIVVAGLLSPEANYAQDNRFYGIILNSETGAPIPYAHIYLVEGESGTTSGPNGRFRLVFPNQFNEGEVTISAVGFQTVQFNLENLVKHEEAEIELVPAIFESDAAYVVADNYKKHRIRNRRSFFSRAAKNLTAPPVEHVAFGFAQHITHNEDRIWPISFKFYLNINDRFTYDYDEVDKSENTNSDSLRFRLRFVQADENGLPTEIDLFPFSILRETAIKSGSVEFDLQEETHAISKSDFFILVEWLVEEPQTQGVIPFYEIRWEKGSHYFRLNPLKKWGESNHELIFDFKYEG